VTGFSVEEKKLLLSPITHLQRRDHFLLDRRSSQALHGGDMLYGQVVWHWRAIKEEPKSSSQ
jgi:hypothetical protein